MSIPIVYTYNLCRCEREEKVKANLSIKPVVKNCLCMCVYARSNVAAITKKKGGEQGRIDKRKKKEETK